MPGGRRATESRARPFVGPRGVHAAVPARPRDVRPRGVPPRCPTPSNVQGPDGNFDRAGLYTHWDPELCVSTRSTTTATASLTKDVGRSHQAFCSSRSRGRGQRRREPLGDHARGRARTRRTDPLDDQRFSSRSRLPRATAAAGRTSRTYTSTAPSRPAVTTRSRSRWWTFTTRRRRWPCGSAAGSVRAASGSTST